LGTFIPKQCFAVGKQADFAGQVSDLQESGVLSLVAD